MLDIAFYDRNNRRLVMNPRIVGRPTISHTENGFGIATITLQFANEATALYASNSVYSMKIGAGFGKQFDGRVEGVSLNKNIITLSVYGYWRAVGDYTVRSEWSTTDYSRFRPMTQTEIATLRPEMYIFDTNNRINIGLKSAQAYNMGGTDNFIAVIVPPEQDTRDTHILQAKITVMLPNLQMQVAIVHINMTTFAKTDIQVFTGTGVPYVSGFARGVASTNALAIEVRTVAGGGTLTPGLKDGEYYARLEDIQVSNASGFDVNTTFTAARAAGTNVTATVGDTSRMFAGQKIIISNGNTISEQITVLSIGSSTQFNATFARSWVIGDTLQNAEVYPHEIMADWLPRYNGSIVPNPLSTDTTLIQNNFRHWSDELIIGDPRSTFIKYARQGDRSGNRWEVGVDDDRKFYFRPRGLYGRTFYVFLSDITLDSAFDTIYNLVRTRFEGLDAAKRIRMTASATDSTSQVQYGITRSYVHESNTGDLTQAQTERDTVLLDSKNPKRGAKYTIRRLFSGSMGLVPLWALRSADTVKVLCLPPAFFIDDRDATTLLVAEAGYDFSRDLATIAPEVPIPRLELLLSAR